MIYYGLYCFPKNALKTGKLIDWDFAANGAGSVLGSTLIVLILISYGFNTALIAALLMYLAAFGLMSMKAIDRTPGVEEVQENIKDAEKAAVI